MRKDKERSALLAGRVRAFIIKDKVLGREPTIELIKLLMPAMLTAIGLYQAPFIYSIELPGRISPLSDLIPKIPD